VTVFSSKNLVPMSVLLRPFSPPSDHSSKRRKMDLEGDGPEHPSGLFELSGRKRVKERYVPLAKQLIKWQFERSVRGQEQNS